MQTDSDADLLLRSQIDATAFDAIYERTVRQVYSYLARRSDAATAEDLLSEVFLRAFEARRRFTPPVDGLVLPWLYGIARNVLLEQRKTRELRVLRDLSTGVDWSSVDDRLDAGSRSPELRQAIGDLSASEREILLLVAWEQLSVAEAAQAVGISQGAARTRLHRARARATASLQSDGRHYALEGPR